MKTGISPKLWYVPQLQLAISGPAHSKTQLGMVNSKWKDASDRNPYLCHWCNSWPTSPPLAADAPHTLADITGVWARPYSIEQAVTPDAHTQAHKYWPVVNRVDNVYGDRNLFCACVPVDDYR